MKKISVKLGNRSYPILIGSGLIKRLTPHLLKAAPPSRSIGLTNLPVYRLYKNRLPDMPWIVLPDGERTKNLATVEKIYHRLVSLKADRQTTLVVVGGGVVGDIGGFVAATYLRGIPFVQVPTTLLAQVDSSVGGKTGVDLKSGKNLIGAFYQPRVVLIDTDFLKTLPDREYLCGLSEVVKYGIIQDERFFDFLEKNVSRLLEKDKSVLARVISRSCEIKAEVVSRDEREGGLRVILNYGHTLGHAIETLSGYRAIHHGEAVSCGMVFSARLSWKRGLCAKTTVDRIQTLLVRLGLPTDCPRYPRRDYARVMSVDKKSRGGKIRFIAVRRIGQVIPIDLTVDQITGYL